MLYLITQCDPSDLERKEFSDQIRSFNDKLQSEGCRLLTHSELWDVFVYGLEDKQEEKVKDLCKAFGQYAKQVFQVEFLSDVFTRDEIEDPANFSPEFIEALKVAEES